MSTKSHLSMVLYSLKSKINTLDGRWFGWPELEDRGSITSALCPKQLRRVLHLNSLALQIIRYLGEKLLRFIRELSFPALRINKKEPPRVGRGFRFPFHSRCKFPSRGYNIHFDLPSGACLLGRFTVSSRCLQLIWGDSQWSRVNEMSTSLTWWKWMVPGVEEETAGG